MIDSSAPQNAVNIKHKLFPPTRKLDGQHSMLSSYNGFDNASLNALECGLLVQLIFHQFLLQSLASFLSIIFRVSPTRLTWVHDPVGSHPRTSDIAANSGWPSGISASLFPPHDLARGCLGRVPCLPRGYHAVLACFLYPHFPNLFHCA